MTSKQEEILYSYLAGMVDADGWVTMSRSGTGNKTYRIPLIGVSLSDKRITKWAKEKFGGNSSSRKARRDNWKPMHTWTISGRNAVYIMARIIPYMLHTLKKRRVKIILAGYEEIHGKGEEREYLREKRLKLGEKVMSIQMRGA